MKVAIVFAALVAIACAQFSNDAQVQVLRYDNRNDGNNQYQYKWVEYTFYCTSIVGYMILMIVLDWQCGDQRWTSPFRIWCVEECWYRRCCPWSQRPILVHRSRRSDHPAELYCQRIRFPATRRSFASCSTCLIDVHQFCDDLGIFQI